MIKKFSSKFSLAGSLPVLVAAVIASSTATSSAILTVTFNGTTGSNVISYEVSGSITALFAANDFSNGFGQILLNGPSNATWNSSVDEGLGDVFVDGSFPIADNDDLVLSNSISLRKNGVEFGVWDTIDLDPNTSDDVEFDPTSTVNYPAMVIGDVFSAIGSGTFTLQTGTYETVFNEGVYQGTVDFGGGPEPTPYQVIVGVPEPSGFLLLGVGGAFCFFRRRR